MAWTIRVVADHVQLVVQMVFTTSSNTVGLWTMRPARSSPTRGRGRRGGLVERREVGVQPKDVAHRRGEPGRTRSDTAGPSIETVACPARPASIRTVRGRPRPGAQRELDRPVVGRGPHRRQVDEPWELRVRTRSTGSPPGPRRRRSSEVTRRPLALPPGANLGSIAARRHRAPASRTVLRTVVEGRTAGLVGAELEVVEARRRRSRTRSRRSRRTPGHARALRLQGRGVRGVEVRVQAGREPDPVEHVGVPRRDRLVVAARISSDRIAEREVGLTVRVGEAFPFREEASFDEEAADLLGGGSRWVPSASWTCRFRNRWRSSRSRGAGGVPVGREIERSHDPRVYTVEIG